MSFRWNVLPRRSRASRGKNVRGSDRASQIRRRLQLEGLEERTLLSAIPPLSPTTWTPLGPAPITGLDVVSGGVTSGAGTGSSTGRIAGVAVDPNNAKIIYIAAANGGVWKTVDGGLDWLPLTDDQASLHMGAIAIAPSDSKVIYAGTGEANESGDSFAGVGVLVSTDSGQTWTLRGQTQFFRRSISKIVVDPTDSKTAYVAVGLAGVNGLGGNTGIWKTTDGGLTWTDTTFADGLTATDAYTDVVMSATDHNTLYAAIGETPGFSTGDAANGVYVTHDGGTNWAPAGNFPGGKANGRIALAIGTSDPNYLYAAVTDPNALTPTGGGLFAFEVSTDGGVTWAKTTPPNYLGTQGWYDTALTVDPNNPKLVYAAGVIDYNTGKNEVIASSDGGGTWIDVTADGATHGPHTDHHSLIFDKNGSLLDGNDGGIWRMDIPDHTKPATFTWTNLNGNLNITAFTAVTMSANDPNLVIGGSQDDGTELFTGDTVWKGIWPGDGGFTAIDFNNPNTFYTSNFGPGLQKSTDKGATWTDITPPGALTAFNFNFYVPYVMSPSNSNELIYATDELDQTFNGGKTWATIALPGRNGFNTNDDAIDALAIAPSSDKWIYVTAGGNIYVSSNGGGSWSRRNIPNANDGFSNIVVDPNDPKTAYIVRDHHDSFGEVGKVFKTTNGGITWNNVTGDLPEIPVYSVAKASLFGIDNKLYVGTDAGVYVSANDGVNWTKMGTGMANAQVVSLAYNAKLNVLIAGTHGRGAWEILGDAVLSATSAGTISTAIEGNAFNFTSLATFTDAGGSDPDTNYTAIIDWGDGTTDTGTVKGVAGVYTVSGTHAYSDEGTFTAVITIQDKDGGIGQAADSIEVQDAPLTPNVMPAVNLVEGSTFNGIIATFVDGNPSAPESDFTTTIDWGNGIVGFGTVTYDSTLKQFDVLGQNAYNEEGTFTGSVTVADVGGSTAVIPFTVNVTDAPLTNPKGLAVSAVEGNPFSGPVAEFTDGNPAGLASDFTAKIVWGNGQTTTNATIIDLGGGRFQVAGTTTYSEEGSYNIAVNVADKGGQTTSATTTATVTDAPISVAVSNVTGVEGAAATVAASFTDGNPSAPQTDYSVTVDFGDNTSVVLPSSALTSLGQGSYSLSINHTYLDESSASSFTIKVTVDDVGSAQGVGTGTAAIADAPLVATGAGASVSEGQQLTNAVVATFIDGFAGAPASDFTAIIDWGDGYTQTATSTPPTQVVAMGGGQFEVLGTNAYAEAGQYPITITILDKGGSTATASASVNVTEVPITAGAPVSFTAQEGIGFEGVVGTFTDANLLSVPKDFFASINWGDGSSSNAQITQPDGPGTKFVVSAVGDHLYAEESQAGQPYQISISVYDIGGANTTLTGTATVTDAPITVNAGSALASVAEGTSISGIVATFTDAYAAAPITDYTATIIWGDGFFTPGTITFDPIHQVYNISGSHVYADEGDYTVGARVDDVGGSTTTLAEASSITITDAPLTTAVGSKISAVSGAGFSGQVASFIDTNSQGLASDFTANISWGDGTTTLGTITQPGGLGTGFLVFGSHTYSKPGAAIPVSIAINDVGGATISATTSAHVLVRLTAAFTSSSNGGATNNAKASFGGAAEPQSIVKVLATANNGTGATTVVGQVNASANGTWNITSPNLKDGRYTFKAQMIDPLTQAIVQEISLNPSASAKALTIDTTGPVVKSVSLNPSNGQLKITVFDAGSGMNLVSLANRGNYQLGFADQQGVHGLQLTNLKVVSGAAGSGLVFITASFNLGARVRAGTYVVTLKAAGLVDKAGNTLVERSFLTFPQTTNAPNPNYVAAITVSANLSASGPQIYVPFREQVVAGQFSRGIRRPGVKRK